MHIQSSGGGSEVRSYSTSVTKLEQDQARTKGEAEAELIEKAGEVSKSTPKAKNVDGVGRRLDLRA